MSFLIAVSDIQYYELPGPIPGVSYINVMYTQNSLSFPMPSQNNVWTNTQTVTGVVVLMIPVRN